MSQRDSEEIIGSSKKSTNKKAVIIVVVVVAVVIIVSVVIWLLLRPEADTSNMVVTAENADQIASDFEETVAEGMFNARMNNDWTFENSHATSTNAYVANSEMNSHIIYFEIILDDTNEVIYKSPNMAVNTKLQNLTLDCDLAAGTYGATCLYHLLNDDGSEYSSVGVAITINILN
jgi:sensor domain CHASE-containing protein